MAIETTGNHPKGKWPGVRAFFGAMYDQHSAEFPVAFEIVSSSQNYEEDVKTTDYGLAPVKTEGRATDYTSRTQKWVQRYTHLVYSNGYIVTEEEIEDNLYPKLAKDRAAALAFSIRQTEETVHANHFNNAFDSSYAGGDGKELLATDHPIKNGTFSNLLDPASDMNEESLEDICIMVMKAVSESGNKIKLIVQKLHVPPDLFYEANRIYKSVLQNDSALNALNVLKSTNAFPGGIHVNHYFDDTDAYFAQTNCPKGMTSFSRRKTRLKKDNDFSTGNALAKADVRFSSGWTDPLCMFGSQGA